MIAAEQWHTVVFWRIAITLENCLAGTVLAERLELKWRTPVFWCATVVLGIPDGSVEDILQCQMALFCVKCVLQENRGVVITQPSSVFATAMDFTFINCHLSSSITINVTTATALAMGLDCQQLQLQVWISTFSFNILTCNVNLFSFILKSSEWIKKLIAFVFLPNWCRFLLFWDLFSIFKFSFSSALE